MNDVCKKEMLAGMFLSKFSKSGLAKLGFETYSEAYKTLAMRVGGNWLSIRNYRDEFDPAFPNGRKGYHKRHMHPSRKDMLDSIGWMDIDALAELLVEQFFGAEEYIAKLDDALNTSTTGAEVATKASKVRLLHPEFCLPNGLTIASREGKEQIRKTKARINQSTFRRWTIANYGGSCCVTGLDIKHVLEAGHISGWDVDVENRMNPCNGICLSSTYHKAFDAHLISFDEQLRMVLSPLLRDACTKEVHKEYFLKYEGVPIRMPHRFPPDKKLMAMHCSRLAS